jgi:2-(1,2-epoxy-1,2-dihydrophenyl)acetyl-CoA isomerase
MPTQDLIARIEDGVATLTMNRPDSLNALSWPMLEAMVDALKRYATDDAVGCVVITGAGRGFCAGGDVKAMAAGSEMQAQGLEAKAHALRERMEVSRLLHELPKPTIAMINGPAAGAGLSMALACDLRTMGAGVRISTAFANVGYSGDFGGSYFLSKLLGTGRARELYFLAERVDAAAALQLGIVNRVAPDEKLAEETYAIAQRLASGPRVALRYMKRNFNAAEHATLKECLDLEAWHHIRTGETEDHKEAARAFVEKRTPAFKGR